MKNNFHLYEVQHHVVYHTIITKLSMVRVILGKSVVFFVHRYIFELIYEMYIFHSYWFYVKQTRTFCLKPLQES